MYALQSTGEQLICIKDDHWLHRVADWLSVHTRWRNLHNKTGVGLEWGRQREFSPRQRWL